MTGSGVSGSNMPSQPWTARPDVSPAEDTSVEALLAGAGLPAGADPELRPVADFLAALSARPAGDELTGLAAAQAEFRRHVAARPAHARQSPGRRRRRFGLATRLSVKAGAATALVVMALGGAAAAAYADVLPGSWQQFAHSAIGAPAYRAKHGRPAGTSAAGSAVPHSRHPAHQTYLSGPPARHRSVHHAGPPHLVWPPATGPFVHHSGALGAHAVHNVIVRTARDGADRRLLRGRE